MGKKKSMPGGEATWTSSYYKTPLTSTDWAKQIQSGWQPYQPSKVSTGFTLDKEAVSKTPYTPLQGDVTARLSSIMGGYTPEGKQKIIEGAMAPVREEAERMKHEATAGAYQRGLGQSGVLPRTLGEIDRSTLARMAEITGGVEQASVQNALSAISAFQQGQASEQDVALSLEQMRQQNAQANAELSQQYEQLKAQINLDDRQMQIMLGQLAQTAYQDDYSRQLAEMEIMNNFGISKAQLEQGKWIAEQNAKKSGWDVFTNILNVLF